MTAWSATWAADELGPAKVVFLRVCTGADAVVVIDNVALGLAIGGVRMRPGVTAGEVARLARAMTVKNAVAGLPHGGGKAGIVVRPCLAPADHERVMRAFAQARRRSVTPPPSCSTAPGTERWPPRGSRADGTSAARQGARPAPQVLTAG
jgi:glutamate dehydrogenase (NAD(P)+)